jgi:hypothetical protein
LPETRKHLLLYKQVLIFSGIIILYLQLFFLLVK